jgi:chromosome segregation ATPase
MGNYSGNGNASADDAAKESQKRRVQMELLILDSDTRKLTNEKNQLDAEIRKLKQDGERIRLYLNSKNGRYEIVLREISTKEEEAKRLKKKLNLL